MQREVNSESATLIRQAESSTMDVNNKIPDLTSDHRCPKLNIEVVSRGPNESQWCQILTGSEDEKATNRDSSFYNVAKTAVVNDLQALMLYQAQISKNRGDFKASFDYYECALELDPIVPQTYRGLALLVFDSLNTCTQSKVLKLFERHASRQSEVLYFRGILFERYGFVSESTRCFRDSISLEPGNYYALNNLAFSLMKLDHTEGVSAMLRHSLAGMRKLEDKSGQLLVQANLARYQAMVGNRDKSLRQLVQLIPGADNEYFATERSYILWNAGDTYLKSGQLDEARRLFELARSHAEEKHLPQQHVASLERLARTAIKESNFVEARRRLTEGLKLAVVTGDKNWEDRLKRVKSLLNLKSASQNGDFLDTKNTSPSTEPSKDVSTNFD